LLDADEKIYQSPFERPAEQNSVNTLAVIAQDYARYMHTQYEAGVRINAMSRHLVALYQGVPGARLWRRHLSENASKATDAIELVEHALHFVLTASQTEHQNTQRAISPTDTPTEQHYVS